MGRPSKYTTEQWSQVISLRDQGLTSREIEKLSGVPAAAVRVHCKRNGLLLAKETRDRLQKKGPTVKLTPEKIEEAAADRLRGVPLQDIAKRLSCSTSYLSTTLSGKGVSVPHPGQAGFSSFEEKFKALAKSRGGEFLGPYQGTGTPSLWRCSRGHEWEARPNGVQKGNWCLACQEEVRISGFLQRAKDFATGREGSLLSSEYKNSYTPLEWSCSKGHSWKAAFSDVVGHGTWCPQCSVDEQKGTIEDCQRFAASKGGVVVSTEYVNSQTHLMWRCKEGHEWRAIPNNIINHGRWCPTCFGVDGSGAQKDLLAFVEGLGIKVEACNRSVAAPMEIDIWCPDQKLAIEFNGLYWHSSACQERGRHYRKRQLLVAAGASLLAIFEDEWANKRPLIEAMIRHRLGKASGVKLDARKLEMRPVSSEQASVFFEANHIDGSGGVRPAVGLWDKDLLVSAMSFRTNFNGEHEIARFATATGYVVRGAAGKLVSSFKERPLFTFSNNRLSSGGVYERLGFELVAENRASYWYTDGRSARVWRYRCRRNNDPEILARFPTEEQQALGGVFSQRIFGDSRPLYRIEDYGHRKWVLR